MTARHRRVTAVGEEPVNGSDARWRCRPPGQATSRPAHCCTGSERSTGCPEPPSAPAARGTLVHSVLEQMFGRPAEERTPDLTAAQVTPVWERMAAEHPELAAMLPGRRLPAWLQSAQELVRTYFTPGGSAAVRPGGVRVRRGDRGRRTPCRCGGSSTGSILRRPASCGSSTTRPAAPPGPDFEARALYQLKFYALMIFRLRGVVPAQLKLIYLADGLSLQYAPSEAGIDQLRERRSAHCGRRSPGPWRPAISRRGRSWMCQWCAHQALCPEFGGTPPPYPGPPSGNPARPVRADVRYPARRAGALAPWLTSRTGPDVRGEDRLGAELGQRVHHRVDLVAADHRPHRPPAGRPAARRSAIPVRG